jgi:hypothetical protein
MKKPKTKYTVDYFIEKFKAIPARKWCVFWFKNSAGQKCVLGHCGVRVREHLTPEAKALIAMFPTWPSNINNNPCKKYPQTTPRARILAALRDIKKKMEKQP